jgi:excisionase family DNA binding protein
MSIGISTGNAARRLGVSQQYVTRLCSEGRLKATQTDLGYLVDEKDLARFAKERAARQEEKVAA